MARAKTTPTRVEPKVESAQERPPCACGCGATPRGPHSRYLPGHDARHASALRKAAAS